MQNLSLQRTQPRDNLRMAMEKGKRMQRLNGGGF
jgi:hypothetical protein